MKNIKFTTPSGVELSYDNVKDLEVVDVTSYEIRVIWYDLSVTNYNMSFSEIAPELQKMLVNKNITSFTITKG